MPQNNDIYPEPPELKPWHINLRNFMVAILSKAIELILEAMEPVLRSSVKPMADKMLDDPNTPEEVKSIVRDAMGAKSYAFTPFLIGMAGGVASSAAGAALLPGLEFLKQHMSAKDPFQIFEYQFVLAAYLRGLNWYKPGEGAGAAATLGPTARWEGLQLDVFDDLRKAGWHEERIEAFKKLVMLRLDPDTIRRIWLRDKTKYDKLWKDLHDQGWDDDRIDVYKELADVMPSVQDVILWAAREIFEPELREKFRLDEGLPPQFLEWAARVGITGEVAKNYWAAHWYLPSMTQVYEMWHRAVIGEDDVDAFFVEQDMCPYWRDKLKAISFMPFTRVDVRRMYKVGVLDREGVKRAYLDVGFDDEKAEAMTEFTIAYYAKPARDEADLEDEENARNRDLTRADVCDGYKRGMLPRLEATESLSILGYDPDEIDFYLDREDLKKDQGLKDAYATNYRQLYVTGIIDDAVVKADLTALGLEDAEVDQLLQLWYIERVRRTERPSRSDLARFLEKEIITEERYQAEMARLGWSDEYIGWYLKDIKG